MWKIVLLGRPFLFPREKNELRRVLVKVPAEVRFLVAVAPRALKVGNRRESSAAIEGLDDGTKEVEALLVAVNAATFLISLL